MTDVPAHNDLLIELAAKLSAAGGVDPLEPVEPATRGRLLRIARDVAHATERQNAPLVAYLVGRFVQDAVRSGTSEAEAVDQAAAVVRSLIGDAAD
jgi:Domain of unknown function (DUF6457)